MAIAMFSYRITVPPVSSALRMLLVSLRSIGFMLLFFLIGEPLLSLVIHSIEQPIAAVLVDNSQSLTIKDKLGRRDDELKSILQSRVWSQIAQEGKVDYILFEGKARTISSFTTDSLTLNGPATDIAKAFKYIKQTYTSSNLQSVILITDGNSTVGENPIYEAEELGIPVFTIGVGDTSDQKDLLVRKVITNEITYVGTKVPVNVIAHSAGFGGEHVLVSLRQGGVLLDEKSLDLESGTRDYLVPLSYVPEKEGMQKLNVEISQLPGELTKQNNTLSVFTKVLKSKMQVILIAGSPNQDVACTRDLLTNDKNIHLKTFIEHGNGRFYEGSFTAQEIDKTDCLVLIGFPTQNSSPQTTQIVLDAINTGKPFLFVLSRTMDFEKLQPFNSILPFKIGNLSAAELQVFVDIPEAKQNNPVVRIGSTTNTSELWSKLPPVFQSQGMFRAKVESDILATVRFQSVPTQDPFIVARNVNRKKSLAVLGYGLWRWNMLSTVGSGTEHVLESFLGNSIRWLTTQEDARRIMVYPAKHIFTTQESIEFTAQVYDENFQPVEDAQIEVHAQHGNEISQIVLNSLGSGQYQGSYVRMPEGDYRYSASVKVNGTVAGNDQGVFSIGGFNTEYLETRMNKSLLQQVAAQTNGNYYNGNAINSLSHDVLSLSNFKAREVSKSTEFELWNSRWILALLVLIFASEWFIRKRNGML